MPTAVVIGLFYVNTMAVRKALVEKHHAIANGILQLIANKVKERRLEMSDKFEVIARTLNRGLTDVEQVAELDEYINNLPTELGELGEQLTHMQSENAVLIEFQYPTSDDEFRKYYKTLAWPKRIDEEIEATL